MVKLFDPETNFWDMYPDLKIKEEIKDLYSKDKSKNKENSSKIMWALFMLHHPDSSYSELSYKEKEMLIKKDYLGDENYDLSSFKQIITFIEKVLTPKPLMLLNNWLTKLEERNDFIASKTYNESSYEMLDKMMKETSALWKGYEDLKKKLEESESGLLKGGAEESLSEKRLI